MLATFCNMCPAKKRRAAYTPYLQYEPAITRDSRRIFARNSAVYKTSRRYCPPRKECRPMSMPRATLFVQRGALIGTGRGACIRLDPDVFSLAPIRFVANNDMAISYLFLLSLPTRYIYILTCGCSWENRLQDLINNSNPTMVDELSSALVYVCKHGSFAFVRHYVYAEFVCRLAPEQIAVVCLTERGWRVCMYTRTAHRLSIAKLLIFAQVRL